MTRKRVSLAAGVTVAHLLRKTIAEHPPIEHPLTLANTTGKMRLGHYLLSLGYITPQHLVRALADQRQSIEQGAPLMLGDILVRAQIIPPRVLTTILLVQLVERLLDLHWQPQRLGEQLVVDGMIDLPTLASAIQLPNSGCARQAQSYRLAICWFSRKSSRSNDSPCPGCPARSISRKPIDGIGSSA